MKPLLVGETNPYGACEEFALYPSPRGCSGWRLCHKVLRLDPDDYLERFDRANLCDGPWSAVRARARALELRRGGPRTYVLLGAKVCRAFGLEFEPFTVVKLVDGWLRLSAGEVFAKLPHPSGLSRAWNDLRAYARARETLEIAGVLP